MQKSAINYEALKQIIFQYGIPSALTGGAVAATTNIAGMIADKKKREAAERKINQGADDIIIRVPAPQTKVAEEAPAASASSPGIEPDYLWKNTMLLGGTLGAGYLGYQGVDALMMAARRKEAKRRLETAKKQYYNILVGGNDEMKTAACQEGRIEEREFKNYPAINGLLNSATEAVIPADMQKSARSGISDNITSALPAAAVASAVLSHLYFYRRRKELDNLYKSQDKVSPRRIRFVTESAPEQPVVATPPVQDETEIKDMLEKSPEEIRQLESQHKPEDTEKAPAILAKDHTKIAGIVRNIMGNIGAANMMAMAGERSSLDHEIAKQKERERILKEKGAISPGGDSTVPIVQRVDANSLIINTPSGPIEIEAEDPNAARYVEKHKNSLGKALASSFDESPVRTLREAGALPS